MQQRASSFYPDWTCSLSGSWMEGWCIVPYFIAHISVRGWAHGRAVEGGRVHAKDKIIQNSILQAGSGLRNVVEVDEWDMDAYNFSLWSIWRVMELQREFVWPNCGHLMDTTSEDIPWIQLSGYVDRIDEPSCTILKDLYFFVCINIMRMSCYVLYHPGIMHLLVEKCGW